MKIDERLNREFKGDWILWFILLALSLISLMAIYSATTNMSFRLHESNTEMYLAKQIAFLLAGIFFAYICHLVRYTKYSSFATKLLLSAIVLLLAVMVFGAEVNNSRRWIKILGFSFQPSDFAEVALIMYLARVISSRQGTIKDDKRVLVELMAPVVIVCALILPSNLSSAALLFFTSLLIMFIGRIPLKYIFQILLVGLVAFAIIFLIGFLFPDLARSHTWLGRISGFLGGEESFQMQQSKIAIANGGLLGVGPGNSMQRSILPYAHADFIYAIICEEYGIIGATIVLLLYFGLLIRCIRLVTLSPKTFGAILAVGLALNLVIQAYANIMVTVGLVPVTGVTLPIISLGGTSLIFTFISFGIILSVSKYIEQFKEVGSAVKTMEHHA